MRLKIPRRSYFSVQPMQSQRYGLDPNQIWITTTMQALAKAGLGLSDCQVLIAI